MNFELKTLDLHNAATEKADALVVLIGDSFGPLPSDGVLAQLIGGALKSGDLTTKTGKLLHSYQPPGVAARNLVVAGTGTGSPLHLQQAIRAAFGSLKTLGARRIVVLLTDAIHVDKVDLAVQAIADTTYVYTATKPTAEPCVIQRVVLGVTDAKLGRTSFMRGQAQAAGIALAKEWGNRPANHATPTLIADAARTLAKLPNISCDILGPKEVAKLGMGSFIGVAQGSEEPLRFIVLKYQGAEKLAAPVVLIGKGITFDTGGISIKPASEMDEMKFDMCGAASVLGTFRAIAELRPKLNVVGLIPACENMPDGRALKPGDVVTSMSGQTIEVLNTDAEGRLVLCDALTYAEQFKPQAVVDVATLTGACVVALGGVRSGLFSTNDKLAQELVNAGDAAQDLCWRMPLDSEYAEGLKTNFADVANIAGRAAGAITAAKFLERFAGKFAWAHLDIAGTAWKSGAAKGATGRPVGLLLHFLLKRAGETMVDSVPHVAPAKSQSVLSGGVTKSSSRRK